MAVFKATEPLDILQQMISDVLVQTGKAIRSASRNSAQQQLTPSQQTALGSVDSGLSNKIAGCVETFNLALDDIESEIVRAQAVLHRDLNLLRKEKEPAAPPTEPEPAPLEEESAAADKDGDAEDLSIEPAAPFADMDIEFDLTESPEMASAPALVQPQPAESPSTGALKPLPAQVKVPPAQPVPANGIAPARQGAPPVRRESKVPLPQFPRSAAQQTPKAPTPAMAADVAATTAASASVPTTAPAAVQRAAVPPLDTTGSSQELGFTDMTFSLAPATTEGQPESQPQAHVQPTFDLTAFAPSDSSAAVIDLDNFPDVSADLTGTVVAPNAGKVDEADIADVNTGNIDEFFTLDSATGSNMDLDLDLDNSNFNDMFLNSGDVSMENPEFDSAPYSFE